MSRFQTKFNQCGPVTSIGVMDLVNIGSSNGLLFDGIYLYILFDDISFHL